VVVQRFLLGKRFAFEDSFLGQRAVASPLLGQAAQGGGSVILHFALHLRIHLTANQDGMRGAGIGARRHGCDVAGLEEKESGRRRSAAARSDIRNDGNR